MSNPWINIADRLGYQSLKLLPPETAHDVGKWVMQRRWLARGPIQWPTQRAPVLFGRRLPNPLGLAAGFDKNAVLVDAAIEYGFGFVEVGSVTFRGGSGNPRPRMFRLDPRTIMNRMGLNGDPAPIVAERLARTITPNFAVNIAKTHSSQILGDAAIEDMLGSYRLLNQYGIYTAINVSCPNTKEGRTFEDPAPLGELLSAITCERSPASKPLVVKLSPVLDPVDAVGRQRLAAVLDVCRAHGVDGYVCCNTLPTEHPKFGRGGLSGDAVRTRALRMIDLLAAEKAGVLIGCGGIFTAADLHAYLSRGCTVAQAYNGFVRGPTAGIGFASKVLA